MKIFEGAGKEKGKEAVSRFDDFRVIDPSRKNIVGTPKSVLQTTTFDTATRWPAKECLPADFDPERLLEGGKNPGLGIRLYIHRVLSHWFAKGWKVEKKREKIIDN